MECMNLDAVKKRTGGDPMLKPPLHPTSHFVLLLPPTASFAFTESHTSELFWFDLKHPCLVHMAALGSRHIAMHYERQLILTSLQLDFFWSTCFDLLIATHRGLNISFLFKIAHKSTVLVTLISCLLG
jgi:hypothetical protein